VVVFADRKDLAATVSKYLFDDEARRSMERKALQFALDMQRDLEHLENAIIAVLHDVYLIF
jgi:ABC-type hemin transport system ATPase subunit